ncbi:hypothetical protein GCM10027425_04440 [Alteromonas gracilis]
MNAPTRVVALVVRRELTATLLTRSALRSTLMLAALALAAPLLFDMAPTDPLPADLSGVLLALGTAALATTVVLLWGIPLATDVLQEKSGRVVEVLLTTLRPRHLLAGKVVATTLVGLAQMAIVTGATVLGLHLAGGALPLSGISVALAAVCLVCAVLAVLTTTTAMAALAARVDRQEELSGALQPALALVMVPLAAATYLAFDLADTVWLDIASMTPVLGVFALPVRLAVEAVPAWQIVLALVVALGTLAALVALAGRIYSGAALRSGRRVGVLEALRTR